jgi:DNA-binding MarR family transcriptional regulator
MSAYSKNRKEERLLQLSEEVGRIAGTLARLSTEPDLNAEKKTSEADIPEVSVQTVSAVIRARRLRERYFSAELFSDPAWDIMLDLLHSELMQVRVSVSNLCMAAAVPATTALRWIGSMAEQGLILRHGDPRDRRRVFIELAPEVSLALRRYFAELERPVVI